MMDPFSHPKNVPSHICPSCGEWWDVERVGHDTWFVSLHGNELNLSAQVWTEAANAPVCPLDTAALDRFNIICD